MDISVVEDPLDDMDAVAHPATMTMLDARNSFENCMTFLFSE